MAALRDWLSKQLGQGPSHEALAYLLSYRQLNALESVIDSLTQAESTLQSPALVLDLATVPLTDALLGIQGLLGFDTTEAVLDDVFSRFCVGK
jgi:tRNA modification GTPase